MACWRTLPDSAHLRSGPTSITAEPKVGVVRVAVRATVRNVVGLVLRQCLQLVLAGFVTGIFAALAGGRVLQRLVQGIQPLHAVTFAVMIPVLEAAALAASFVPARRASRVDPVRALRQE